MITFLIFILGIQFNYCHLIGVQNVFIDEFFKKMMANTLG